jgi:hypothetical protein
MNEWISVEEKLPNNGDSVLCFRELDNWYVVCDYLKRTFVFGDMEKAHLISHWQPLPEPPKD